MSDISNPTDDKDSSKTTLSIDDIPSAYSPPQVSYTDCIDQVSFFGGDALVEVLRVPVDSDSYEYADRISHHLWTKEKKRGKYNDGCINTKDDPSRATRTGLLGEMAFASVFDQEVDLKYRKGGSPYDFILETVKGPFSIDLKTSHAVYKTRTQSLIKSKSSRGHRVRLKSQIYVAAYIDSEDRLNGCADVVLIGFQTNTGIKKLPDVQSPVRGGRWYNKELNYTDLHPILDLCKLSTTIP